MTYATSQQSELAGKLRALRVTHATLQRRSASARAALHAAKDKLAAAVAKTATLQKRLDRDEARLRALKSQVPNFLHGRIFEWNRMREVRFRTGTEPRYVPTLNKQNTNLSEE